MAEPTHRGRVLVAYATRYGATREIAECIAGVLGRSGFTAEVRPADEVTRVAPYDAVVVGSAVYFANWLPGAIELLESFQDGLAQMPVWVFSDGPTEAGDPVTLMGGWRYPERLAPLLEVVRPQGMALFAGRVEAEGLGLEDWLINPALRGVSGDFRDWSAIRAWAEEIAGVLGARERRGPLRDPQGDTGAPVAVPEKERAMTHRPYFTKEDAERVGQSLGITWDRFDVEQFRMGLDIELEHGRINPKTDVTHDDSLLTGKIALAHLNEFPDYYTRLAKMEAEAEAYWKEKGAA